MGDGVKYPVRSQHLQPPNPPSSTYESMGATPSSSTMNGGYPPPKNTIIQINSPIYKNNNNSSHRLAASPNLPAPRSSPIASDDQTLQVMNEFPITNHKTLEVHSDQIPDDRLFIRTKQSEERLHDLKLSDAIRNDDDFDHHSNAHLLNHRRSSRGEVINV